MKPSWLSIFAAWSGLVLLGFRAHAAQPAFTASLDRSTIYLGEQVQFILTFVGEPPRELSMDTHVPDLIMSDGRQEQNHEILNGQTKDSWIYIFNLRPTRLGEFRIPPVRARFSQTNLVSQPLELRVVDGRPILKSSENGTRAAFLKLYVPEQTVYVGQAFPVEIQLYVRHAKDVHMPQLQAEGFTFGKPVQAGQSTSQIGNSVYNVVAFRIPAVAAKAGALKLGPAECSLAVPRKPVRNDFFGDFFTEWVPADLSSDTLPMHVLPLPSEDKPADFNGAVGRFSMQVAASPTNLVAGDPITLRVQISGTGALENLNLRDRPDWPGFKVYPAKSELETSDPLGLTGVKRFEQVIVPDNPAVTAIPEIEFSYFDPERKSYERLSQAPIKLTVSAGAIAQPTVLAGKTSDETTPPPELVHIKPVFGSLQSLGPPLVTRPWFLAVQSLPLLGWLGALVWRKRRERLEKNPRLQRQWRVRRDVLRMLDQLARLAKEDQPDEFFSLAFRMLQEQIGERLNLPSSSITEEVLEEKLPGQKPRPELQAQLDELFQICNQARYAPQRTPQELLDLVPKFQTAIAQLQRLPHA